VEGEPAVRDDARGDGQHSRLHEGGGEGLIFLGVW
jgi:hypothetical protein